MTVEQFWGRITPPLYDNNDCWEWRGAKSGKLGYGHLVLNDGKRWQAHRLAWTLVVGPIPEGMEVCHKCDNARCIRVRHLFIGTHLDNMRDAASKKRLAGWKVPIEKHARGERQGFRLHPEKAPKGERNGRAKLTADDVISIRSSSLFRRELQESYGMSKTQIGGILRRETWKHI